MTLRSSLCGAVALTALCVSVTPVLGAEKSSLQDNLRKLEQRLQSTRPAAPKPEAAPRPVRRVRRETPKRVAVVRATPVARPASHPEEAAGGASYGAGPLDYVPSRIGVKPRAGDVQVSAAAGGNLVHVYFKQKLVSSGGNGTARLPDLAPGKYPVMVWSPGNGPRRTFWISVRKGSTACLSVNL